MLRRPSAGSVLSTPGCTGIDSATAAKACRAAGENALTAQRDRDVSVSLDQSLSVRSGSRSRTVVVASRVSARSLALPGAAW